MVWISPHKKNVINQINSVLQDVKNQKQQFAHYDRVKHFTPPEQRLRRKRSNQFIRASLHFVAAKCNDLVLVDLSERQAATSHRSQNTITPSSSAAPSPSAGLSENQYEPGFTTVSTRPHRAAADHARRPG